MILEVIKKIFYITPFILILILIFIKFGLIQKPDLTLYPLFNDLKFQNKPKSQTKINFNDSNYKSTLDSIVPNNVNWYKLDPTQFEVAEQYIKIIETIKPNLEIGKKLYDAHCLICHNFDGKGNGWIIEKVTLDSLEEGFPHPQDFTRDITKNFSDKRLFHILSSGQNLMFPVSYKLNETERWQLVYYIRHLQNK